MKFLLSLATLVCALATNAASAVGPAPAPLKQKEVLTIGYVKVGHLSAMLMLEEELKHKIAEVSRQLTVKEEEVVNVKKRFKEERLTLE